MRRQSNRFAGLLAEVKEQQTVRRWKTRPAPAALVAPGTMPAGWPPLRSVLREPKDQRPPKHKAGFSERYLPPVAIKK